MFHTRNAPRMPRRADAGAMRAPAWREAYAQRGWAVTALDPTAAVVDHAVLITSPPDGRYALLGPPQQAQQAQQQEGDAQQGQGWVRALVFPLDAAEQEARLDVMLVGFLPNGVQLFSKPMALLPANSSSGGGLLFAAQGEMTVSCVGAAGDPAAHCHAPAELATIQVGGWPSGTVWWQAVSALWCGLQRLLFAAAAQRAGLLWHTANAWLPSLPLCRCPSRAPAGVPASRRASLWRCAAPR